MSPSASRGAGSGPTEDISEMLDRARTALDALKKGTVEASKPSPLVILTLISVVIAALAGLVVHTFYEKGGVKVDATSVALLAVVLIAPFVPKLKAIELGGAKAQWQEDATSSISEVITVIEHQHSALERLYKESVTEAQTADEIPPQSVVAVADQDLGNSSPRVLNHVLWVDDHPANNSYEVEALRTIARVTTVTDTSAAVEVLRTQQVDAVISDIGRSESGRYLDDAGRRLLEAIYNLDLEYAVPVLFYASATAVERHGPELTAAGALTVTASHRELFAALRAWEVEATRHAVLEALRTAPGVVIEQDNGPDVDYIIRLPDGRRVGVEIGAWVTRPQMSAFADRVDRLAAVLQNGHAEEGWLLVRDEVVDARRREFADVKDVRLLSLNAFRQHLRRVP